jgi:hypothetical protein
VITQSRQDWSVGATVNVVERAQQWVHTLIELLRDAGLQLTH